MSLTAEQRSEFGRAKCTKMIRGSIYEVGFFIGVLSSATPSENEALVRWQQFAVQIALGPRATSPDLVLISVMSGSLLSVTKGQTLPIRLVDSCL
jgi:hypothetical protein